MDMFTTNQEAVATTNPPRKIDLLDSRLEKFVAKYIETGVIAEAERAAGYSPTYGKQLLKRPDVQAIVKDHRERGLQQHDNIVETIIADLEAIAELDPIEAYELSLAVKSVIVRHDSRNHEDGISIEDVQAELRSIPKHIRKMLDISFTAKGIQIKYPDKLKAREMLLKIKGAYAPQKIDLNIPLLGNINVIEGG